LIGYLDFIFHYLYLISLFHYFLTAQTPVVWQFLHASQALKEKNADVTNFIRFEVGEGIEKAETDFAAEVAAMSKQS